MLKTFVKHVTSMYKNEDAIQTPLTLSWNLTTFFFIMSPVNQLKIFLYEITLYFVRSDGSNLGHQGLKYMPFEVM